MTQLDRGTAMMSSGAITPQMNLTVPTASQPAARTALPDSTHGASHSIKSNRSFMEDPPAGASCEPAQKRERTERVGRDCTRECRSPDPVMPRSLSVPHQRSFFRGPNQNRWSEASRSPLAWRFGAEAWREAVRTLTTLERIGRGRGRQDAEPDELRTELVADVHRLHGCVFEVQPHLRDGVTGPAAHAGGGILVVGLLV